MTETSLSVLSLLVLVALLSGVTTAQYGRRPTDPIPKPADVCESPLAVTHPGSKVKQPWPTYNGKRQTVPRGCRPKKNLIFMVSDGFGTASETIAREFHQYKAYGDVAPALSDEEGILPLDTLLVGAVRTKSADAYVPDSSSGATAFSCGVKTRNEAIGVNRHMIPQANVMEAAKHKGWTTGLVATSRISHATPAAWSAHITFEDWENEIAAQQIGDNVLGRNVDLMLGGGLRHFTPKSVKGSKREDDRDLLKEAKEKYGFKTIIKSRTELLNLKESGQTLPLIGLFANSHMDYEIDRNKTVQPSLAEMAHSALAMLTDASSTCDSPGFFVMIEGSRIDHAGHSNDVGAHVHDILAYQEAVAIAKSFVEQHPNTMLISTSDHETGGVTVAQQVDKTRSSGSYYNWHPDRLAGVKASVESFSGTIKSAPDAGIEDLIRKLVADKLDVTDMTAAELATIMTARKNDKQYPTVDAALNQLISNRAWVGWTTHGHTGMDVNLYARNAPGLKGNMDNTYLGKYTANYLGVADVMPKLTQRLAKQKVEFGTTPKLRRRHEH